MMEFFDKLPDAAKAAICVVLGIVGTLGLAYAFLAPLYYAVVNWSLKPLIWYIVYSGAFAGYCIYDEM